VAEAARILQLEPLMKRRPRELSGGQRQRVAIGRAIVREPQVFLFDEPLSNLDAALRINTRVELAKLHKLLKATMIYVTHDQVEAMTLADNIVVMNKGRIAQVGRPLDLYYRPDNLFVAGFIGSPAMNILPARVVARDKVELGEGLSLALKLPASVRIGQSVQIGCRPEHIVVGKGGKAGLSATADLIERLGETGFAHLRIATGQTVVAEVRGEPGFAAGGQTSLTLDPGHLHVFGEDGNAIR
jgi:ABC-type sugar transport system ATPase subunit